MLQNIVVVDHGPTVAVRVQQAPLGLARPGCVSIDKGTSGILISNCNVRVTTMASYEATDRHNPIRMGPNMDGPGRASSRLASGSYTSACEGGALPVRVSITGPREPHDYRVCNPMRLSRSTGCFWCFRRRGTLEGPAFCGAGCNPTQKEKD